MNQIQFYSYFFFRSLNIFHLVKKPFTIDQIIFQHHKRSKEIFSFIQSKIHLTSLLSDQKQHIIEQLPFYLLLNFDD